jgi:subtilisin-like proprotein convertase family protein
MERTTRTRTTQIWLTAAVMGLAGAPAAHAALAVQHDSTVVTETAGNANGIPEPGETLAVTENVLSAEPDLTLTGVTGTLTTASPDATVGSGVSAYPDLAFGMPTANTVPFAVTLSSAMECGAAVPFSVALQTSAGPTDAPFTLRTGAAGAFAPYNSIDVPRVVPDGGTIGSDLTVAGTGGRAKGVRVRIGRITHSYDGDLTLTLVAPDGRSVKLVGAKGGAGQDFVGTVFDDAAAAPIRTTTPAPFTGTFRPAQLLSAMDGAPLAGTWTLKVTDSMLGNIGVIEAWGADLAPAVCAPPPTPPPTGEDEGDDDDNGHGHGHGHGYGHGRGRGHREHENHSWQRDRSRR